MNKEIFFNSVSKIWSGLSTPPLYNIEANLGEQVLTRLIQKPADVYLVCNDTGVELTCSQVYKRSLKIANYLNNLGLKQHDVLGLMAMNSENVIPLMFACFSMGIAVNPLMITMTEQEVTDYWSKTKPKAVFCDGLVVPVVLKALDKLESKFKIFTLTGQVDGCESIGNILLENFKAADFIFPALQDIASTSALIMCSSGTTSSPKNICVSHRQALAMFYPYCKPDTESQTVSFCSFSCYWISQPLFAITSALYGHKLIITSEVVTPDLWMDVIDKYKVTLALTLPPAALAMLKSPKLRKLESLKVLIFTGARFSDDLVKDLKSLVPNGKVYCSYGCTELGTITTSSEIKGTSSGYPARNTKIKIIDELGNQLGSNEVGEIYVKTLVPFPGYFNDSKTTKEAFDHENYFKTGDAGYFDDDGFLYIVERIKQFIKPESGIRVMSIEIEQIINEIEGVVHCCVVGIHDRKTFYDVVYAFIIKNKSFENLTEEYVINYVNERASVSKKITGGVYFVDSYPMTASGKIKSRELKDLAEKLHEKKMSK